MELVQWAQDLAWERLSGSLPRRWAHVQGVAARADHLAAVVGSDGELLRVAARLHDVGYAPELAVTGFHPLDGAWFLRDAGAPERLCALVAHHSAARYEAEVFGVAGQLAEFEDERTPVRDALWFCDMTVGPAGDVVSFGDRMTDVRDRYGPEHVVTRALDVSIPERTAAVRRTQERAWAAGLGQV